MPRLRPRAGALLSPVQPTLSTPVADLWRMKPSPICVAALGRVQRILLLRGVAPRSMKVSSPSGAVLWRCLQQTLSMAADDRSLQETACHCAALP